MMGSVAKMIWGKDESLEIFVLDGGIQGRKDGDQVKMERQEDTMCAWSSGNVLGR